eukprot:scaffold9548_cov108-Cylindrotheca_fusiformis.AAC.2
MPLLSRRSFPHHCSYAITVCQFVTISMLDVSTPEFHHLFRILSKRVILWTAMHVDETLAFTDELDRHLQLASPELHPITIQIGGKSSEYSARACQLIQERYGYDEINFNIDCPSNRVSGKRQFGAILMADSHKDIAYDVIEAMGKSTTIPISVKTRVGCETPGGNCLDSLEHLVLFIGKLRERGCKRFFIHARKCVIGGLSPIQNRIVPPLNYPRVYQLCKQFPDCEFIINGGIPGLQAAKEICHGIQEMDTKAYEGHAVPCQICNVGNGSCTTPPLKNSPPNLVGCMLGRACMENPAMFHDIDRYWYGENSNPCQNRRQVLEQYVEYLNRTYPRRCCDTDDDRVTTRIPAPKVVENKKACPICCENIADGKPLKLQSMEERCSQPIKIITRVIDRSLKPILGLFFGMPKSKLFRRECERLSRDAAIRNCGPGYILSQVLERLPSSVLDHDFVKTEDLMDIPVHHGPAERPKKKS